MDPEKVWPGMKLLILEVTGNNAALLEADANKKFHQVDLPIEAAEMRELIAENKEPAKTSALYMGGCGGQRQVRRLPKPHQAEPVRAQRPGQTDRRRGCRLF